MPLTDTDALAHGRAALVLLDLSGDVSVYEADPDGDKQAIQLELGEGDWRSIVGLRRDVDGAEAVVWIAEQIDEYISESREFWGVAFPRCPGHVHAANYAIDDHVVSLQCPQTGTEIRRVTV